jgi:hypothetical protein
MAVGFVIYKESPRSIHFTEQVQLSSGQIIHVERMYKVKLYAELGGPQAWKVTYTSLHIIEPTFVDNPPPTWDSETGLLPILLDKDHNDGRWTLLTTFDSCEAWYQLGRPKLPYAEFQVADHRWQRVDFQDKWVGRSANVSTDVRGTDEPRLLTIAEKRRRNSEPGIAPKYIQIVAKWTTGC